MRGRVRKLSSAPDRHSWRIPPCGGSSTVEPRPSKALTRVRLPSAAPLSHRVAARTLCPGNRGGGWVVTRGMTEPARGRVRVEPGAKRLRAYLGGHLVFDTIRPLLVWEVPYSPAYYVPAGDVVAELVPTGNTSHSPSRGDAEHLTVRVDSAEARAGAVRYPDPAIEELRDHVRFEWAALDAWFEEDEQVFTHPRSPYTRVDVLPSSRRVRVALGDTVLAESTHAHALFETGLPPRWYVPRTDVRMELLVPSDTVTHCPYKGRAEHLSARTGDVAVDDVAWSYPAPLPESTRIAGLVAFYDDRVEVTVDGERQGG